LDIYISKDAKKLSDKNFTVIFLHGGGYYLSDKRRKNTFNYLDKGMNVVNLNYRLKERNTNSDRRLNKCAAFLKANNKLSIKSEQNNTYRFSAGAHIASYVGISANNLTMKTN
jgi:acetyl esterase/lipase